MNIAPIILASKSPRRSQLLTWAEVPFRIIASHTDESYPAHLTPEEIAQFIANEKALAVHQKLEADRSILPIAGKSKYEVPILSADTIVVLDGEIIGKPVDSAQAINTLSRLSGRVHRVITGVCILHHEQQILFADTTHVEFHQLSPAAIDYYVNKYKPFDKAGAYAIQEWIGVVGIKTITGDFYNVMGLPVSRVLSALVSFQ